MKARKFVAIGAVCVVGMLAVTACTGNNSDAGRPTPLTLYSIKPENPLLPANTNEPGGGNIVDAVFRGLVRYNSDTAAPELSMAESITSSDNTVWTIKLKAGQTFQDGTPVDANAFVNAWNWGAYGPNGALNNYFFAPIAGYDTLNPADPDGPTGPLKAPAPTAKSLTGLKVDSPTQFTVTLTTPQSFFPLEVGYTAFYPLPASFYQDVAAFGRKPIGNGPFQVISGDGDTGFTLQKWAGYKGPDQPRVAKVTFKTYMSPSAGYSDLLAGNLDFMSQVPPAALVNDQYQADLPGRFSNKPVGKIQTATLPQYDENFESNPDIGKALSLAIDRPAITKAVFNNGRTPATGWVSPVVDGYKAGACGDFCTYNPTLAKQYLAKSPFKGPFSFSYNAEYPGGKETAEAICNSIKNALAVACLAKTYVNFATFRKDIEAHRMTNMFRSAWQMDYPSIQDFLEPIYATGASSNDGLFSDPRFDALIKKADSQEGATALATYQQAEALLAQSMTVIPLWYDAQQSGWSERLSDVKVTPFSTLDLSSVTIK
jgi:oligopeptide transport system substrate-binding protein